MLKEAINAPIGTENREQRKKVFQAIGRVFLSNARSICLFIPTFEVS
jgi:hypothetical protein